MQADKLKTILSELGWKQSDLARKLEVTGTTVSRWATGEPIPPYVDQYLGVMLEIDRLHRLYIQPPKRGQVYAPTPESLNTDAPKVKGRAARMAKKLKGLKEGDLFAADGASLDKVTP